MQALCWAPGCKIEFIFLASSVMGEDRQDSSVPPHPGPHPRAIEKDTREGGTGHWATPQGSLMKTLHPCRDLCPQVGVRAALGPNQHALSSCSLTYTLFYYDYCN